MMCAFSWTGFGTVKFDVAAVVMLHVPVGITVSVHDIAGRQTSARTSAMRRDGPILSASECERLAPPERAAAPNPGSSNSNRERGATIEGGTLHFIVIKTPAARARAVGGASRPWCRKQRQLKCEVR